MTFQRISASPSAARRVFAAVAAAILLSFAAAPVASRAEPTEKAASGEEVFFDAASWRALVEGKTVYYEDSNGPIGREYFPPGGNRAFFEHAGGNFCLEGTWSEKDGVFCFEYDRQHCFYHLEKGGEIYARLSDFLLQKGNEDQRVAKIVTEPFTCQKGLTS